MKSHLIKYFFVIFTLLINGHKVFAFPQYLEVWFLKSETTSFFDLNNNRVYGQRLAQSPVCLPYGDKCFDPQVGLYDDPNKSKVQKSPHLNEKSHLIKSETGLKNAIESDLINCDKNYYFDLYCGKAKVPTVSDAQLEVWVDISSSMRELDSSSADGRYCKRREVIERIQRVCGKANVETIVFDTSFKRIVDLSQACITEGLNDQKRMIDWLKNSQANNLLFITDINEAGPAFETFLRDHAAKVFESKTFADLLSRANDMGKYCQRAPNRP